MDSCRGHQNEGMLMGHALSLTQTSAYQGRVEHSGLFIPLPEAMEVDEAIEAIGVDNIKQHVHDYCTKQYLGYDSLEIEVLDEYVTVQFMSAFGERVVTLFYGILSSLG